LDYKKDKPLTRKDLDKHKKVTVLTAQKDRYEQFWRYDLARYTQNARGLWGLQYGQWPDFVVQKLISQGRRPQTFNILLDKAQTFIGSIMGNGFDIRYTPATGKLDSLCLKLQDMYYSDQSLMDWDMSELECLLDSAAGVGYESLFVSSKFHDLGNLAFIKRNPRRVMLSPAWKSSNVDELHDYITWGRFSVTEILDLFPIHKPRLDELRNREELEGVDYGEQIGINDYQTVSQKWGDTHLVIELHWIEKEREQWEFDKKNGCLFPETFEKFHSKEDIAQKLRYIQMMNLQENDIMFVSRTKVKKYVRAVCPTLDAELLLLDNLDPVQIGNVNLFPIGIKMEGQYQGLVDQLWDVQRGLNLNQMHQESIQRTSAKNGLIADKALSGGDPELEQEIESRWNEDAPWIWVAEGAMQDLGSSGGIIPMPRGQVTSDIFEREGNLLKMADNLSKLPPELQGRNSQKVEANKMFENRVALAQVGQKYYNSIYQEYKKAKAMAYARQAKITYAGAPREFAGRSGDETFKINQSTDENGMPILDDNGRPINHDDISLLPEMKVTMVPSKKGVNIRSQIRDDFGEILKAIQGDPNNRPLTLAILDEVMDMTELPDDGKESISKTIQLLTTDARLTVALSIMQKQAQLQKAMGGGQQQPAGGLQGGGENPTLPPQQVVDNVNQKAGLPPSMLEQPANKDNVPQQTSGRKMDERMIKKGTPQQNIKKEAA
jgi:hypothetical protein